MLRFADLCAGIGGFRLGLEAAGWQCVYSCEVDPTCESTYQTNFRSAFDTKNIFDIDASDLGEVDAICCGFPCQPFSIAGNRRGFDDKRGTIVHHLIKIASVAKPSILILENVANFASHNGGKSLSSVVNSLTNIGYNVHTEILNSALFGVPQSRPRIYIIAVRQHLTSSFRITKHRTTPEPFRPYIVTNDASIPISKKWQEYIDLYTGKKMLSAMNFEVPKTRQKIERINRGAILDDCVLQMRSSGIRACNIDAPLPTFAVSVSGGGAMIPVYTRERRHLNLQEMKNLMGFPPTFVFPVARTHAIKQLANAVCPAVVTSIAHDIVSSIKQKPIIKSTNEVFPEAVGSMDR